MRQAGELAKKVAAVAEKAKSQEPCSDKKPPIPERIKPAPKPKTLLPARYQNRDFFICDLLDYALKDDGASMEAPIFTLSTKRDLSSWEWHSADGSKHIEVYPSIKGRATQFD
ncbi:MAG: replication initiator protein A, partial [Candidatus Nitrosoglobus sp.]